MIMYKTPKDLIKKELSLSARNQLYPIIQMGDLVYRDIISGQEQLFSSKVFAPLLSRIRTSAIHCQLDLNMVPTNFPFKCQMKKVNQFKLYIPELTIGNLILHIAPAYDRDSLPSFAKYKQNYSNYNTFDEKQIVFDYQEDPFGIQSIKDDIYYGIVTFGGKYNLEFVNLIIPAPGFRSILYQVSLKSELKLIKIDTESTEVKRRRLEIREHVQEEIDRKEKVGEKDGTE
ncbi:hypothetical protein SAMN05660297_02727 [Natronincola peptidivorans]|uniref:Uncharacterized protein n=1 Tax=Natronincola peptidivorans TaxID=426128 RepID=A0A1I0F9Q3_9FIRM|nr:hypothetical protein [Natronincola peptidivorans]SET54924.1 hypothetical protein SAMN05660297_02727 [Natronincola peptidivorans]